MCIYIQYTRLEWTNETFTSVDKQCTNTNHTIYITYLIWASYIVVNESYSCAPCPYATVYSEMLVVYIYITKYIFIIFIYESLKSRTWIIIFVSRSTKRASQLDSLNWWSSCRLDQQEDFIDLFELGVFPFWLAGCLCSTRDRWTNCNGKNRNHQFPAKSAQSCNWRDMAALPSNHPKSPDWNANKISGRKRKTNN